MIHRSYDADADKSIRLSRWTDHTLMQNGNLFWHELLWLYDAALIEMILETSRIFLK